MDKTAYQVETKKSQKLQTNLILLEICLENNLMPLSNDQEQ